MFLFRPFWIRKWVVSSVFVNVGKSAELFLTAWNPLLPVELEVENEMKRDMFECRGISGRKRRWPLDDWTTCHEWLMSHFWLTHFFFYDLARPGSKLTLSSRDKICTCKTLQCCGWLNVIIFQFKKKQNKVLPFIVYSSLQLCIKEAIVVNPWHRSVSVLTLCGLARW